VAKYEGKFVSTKDVWLGEFKDGKRDGLVKITSNHGPTREFQCNNGEEHGYYLQKFANGDIYSYYYRHGRSHGLYYQKYGEGGEERHYLYENGVWRRTFTEDEVK
jgi:hypothetical protein